MYQQNRQQTLDAQNRAKIAELERLNSATNASLQSALVLNQERVNEFKTEILQHERLAAALQIQLDSVKKEGEEALAFVHAECQRLRKALADAVEREQARHGAEDTERQDHRKEAAALAANYQAALKRIAKLDLELQISVMEAQAERNATQGLRDEVNVEYGLTMLRGQLLA
jgi:predicted TIM-barrel fold metal-dependent hydrolase